ncbi:MAG: hypothetical protein H8F28_14155, partial [Fibrella sp.]|nr:hypothetical protein [Armatimonadota bacterium]
DGMADAIQKRQAEEMKQNYGFNDAQTKRYFQKQAKINTDTQARLTLLRKKMVATKDKVEKRQVAKQMRDVLAASDKKMYVALLSIATPGQRPRISPNQ